MPEEDSTVQLSRTFDDLPAVVLNYDAMLIAEGPTRVITAMPERSMPQSETRAGPGTKRETKGKILEECTAGRHMNDEKLGTLLPDATLEYAFQVSSNVRKVTFRLNVPFVPFPCQPLFLQPQPHQ
jgi:precorrin-6x reductase